MPEIVYDWVRLGDTEPWMQIHKDQGSIKWNAKAQQLMGFPRAVCLFHDVATNTLGIMVGTCRAVMQDDESMFKIDAKDLLEESGLEFPLDDHVEGTPVHSGDSRNLLVFALE